MKKTTIFVAVLVVVGSWIPSRAAVQAEVAPPVAAITGFAAPVVVAARTQGLEFLNTDSTSAHNVESLAIGPDSSPWCDHYQRGHCPLFASALVSAGAPVTADLSHTVAGQSYAFICLLHPNTMKGTLMVVA